MAAVDIGHVEAFPWVEPDKEQAKKVLEEAAEVFGAWQAWSDVDRDGLRPFGSRKRLLDECADLMQATCNLVASLGVSDFTGYMHECERRNRARGRYGAEN